MYQKFYVHEIAAVDLSKIYLLKNAMKTCKPNNRDLNRDWIRFKVHENQNLSCSNWSQNFVYSKLKFLKIQIKARN